MQKKRSKQREWIICKNFILKEQCFLGKNTDGTAEYDDGVLTVTIKQNLDDYSKAITICHEIAHGLDFAFKEAKTDAQIENICNDLPKMIISLWLSYSPFRKGLVESDLRIISKKKEKS